MQHKIIVTDPIALLNAIDFAQRNGCLDALGRSLCHLVQVCARSMAGGTDPAGVSKPREDVSITAEIMNDFAPHSMTFAIWAGEPTQYVRPDRGCLMLNGGFIYHGPGAAADGSAPSFNVDLRSLVGEMPKHSWSIHT